MKKNLLGAIVIIFVAFACFLVINEVTNKNTSELEIQQFYSDVE
ncbi:hypothetical protein [Formosa maritima]|nr:hypothetical protein [Formosa maritima]